jgi:hypothetical protein
MAGTADQLRRKAREQLERAVEALARSEGWQAWVRTRAAFRLYSLHNTLLIARQRPDATRVASWGSCDGPCAFWATRSRVNQRMKQAAVKGAFLWALSLALMAWPADALGDQSPLKFNELNLGSQPSGTTIAVQVTATNKSSEPFYVENEGVSGTNLITSLPPLDSDSCGQALVAHQPLEPGESCTTPLDITFTGGRFLDAFFCLTSICEPIRGYGR